MVNRQRGQPRFHRKTAFLRGALYIFWVRGPVIEKRIDFHDFGIRKSIDFRNFVIGNSKDFYDFGVRKSIDFRNFVIGNSTDFYDFGVRNGIDAFSENWHNVECMFLKNWYKVGHIFSENWLV